MTRLSVNSSVDKAMPVRQSSAAESSVPPMLALYSVPPEVEKRSKYPPSPGERMRLRIGSHTTSSEISCAAAAGAENVLVLRFRNCMPQPEGEPDNPISITAVLELGSITTPQLLQLPPEVLASPVLPLVKVAFTVVPLMRYTSVPFAVQTVSPVPESDEQELTTSRVAIDVAGPGGSMGTTCMPVFGLIQLPLGT